MPAATERAQLGADAVAERTHLGAYAHLFGATGHTFYDDAVTEFFSPDAAGKTCILVTAIGESPRLRCARPGGKSGKVVGPGE